MGMYRSLIGKFREIPAAVKASIFFVVCSVLQKGISFITTPIFTRLLTTAEYGTYNVFQSWYQILSIFMTLNLSYGVFNNAMMKYEGDRNRYMSSMQGLVFLNSCIYIFIYFLFQEQIVSLSGLSTDIFLMMFVIILFLPAQNYWMAKQRYEFKYKALVIITVLSAVLTPIISILFICFTPYKAKGRIIGMLVVSVIFGGSIWILNLVRGKKLFVQEYWAFALSFNIPLIPHYLSQTVLTNCDRIMIKHYYGFSEAGIYSVAYSAGMILTILNTSINSSLAPWTYKKMKDAEYKSVGKLANLIVTLIAGIIFFVICMAPEVIAILASDEYRDAVWVIPPIATSVYFMFLYNLFGTVEFYFEKNKIVMVASITGAILNIILNAIFIPMFGYVAAAYTTLGCYILFSLCHYIAMVRICKEKKVGSRIYNIKYIFFISLTLLVMSFVASLTYDKFVIRYLLAFLVAIYIYIKREMVEESIMKFIEKPNK